MTDRDGGQPAIGAQWISERLGAAREELEFAGDALRALLEVSRAEGATQADVDALGDIADAAESLQIVGGSVVELARASAIELQEAIDRELPEYAVTEEEAFEIFRRFVERRGSSPFTIRDVKEHFSGLDADLDQLGSGFSSLFAGWQESVKDLALEDGQKVRWVTLDSSQTGVRGPKQYALAEVIAPKQRLASPTKASSTEVVDITKQAPQVPSLTDVAGLSAARPATQDAEAAALVMPKARRTEIIDDASASLDRVLETIFAGHTSPQLRAGKLYQLLGGALGLAPEDAATRVRELHASGRIFRSNSGGSLVYSLDPAVGQTGAKVENTGAEGNKAKAELTEKQLSLAKDILDFFVDNVAVERLYEPRQIMAAIVERQHDSSARIDISEIKVILRRLADLNITKVQAAKEGKGKRARAKRVEVLKGGIGSREVYNVYKRSPRDVLALIGDNEKFDPGNWSQYQ